MRSSIRQDVFASLSLVAAILFVIVIAPQGAGGQQVVWSASGQTTGDDLNLVYTEISYSFTDRGVSPIVSLGGYGLWTDGSDTWQINPAAGLRVADESGMVSGKVGYAFFNDEGSAGTPFFGGTENGVTSTLMGEYWGDGSLGLQGIASGNWGSEYLWTRGRATFGVADTDRGAIHLGGEVVWQGELDDDPLFEKFESWEYGPLLQWRGDNGVHAEAGAGWKDDSFSDDTYYLRLGLVVIR